MIDYVELLAQLDEQRPNGEAVGVALLLDKAAAAIQTLLAALEKSQRREQNAWHERNHAIAKMKAWESTVVVTDLPVLTVPVREWGPGDGEIVQMPSLTTKRLTDLLDELAQAIEILREVVDYYDSPDGKVHSGPSYAFSAAEFLAKHGDEA